MSVFSSLTLPNGTMLLNRLAKAAMEENMADADHAPSDELITLYQRWATGGVGLMLTGNVMIDRRAMTGPGGVVLESDKHKDKFEWWAKTARSHGAAIWMQINHPGRQMPAALGQETLAPSAVSLDLGSFSKQFAEPKAMSSADIADVKARFVRTAMLAQECGFNGVQIHAAHGYLLSQFLSPITNKRKDRWGGSIENRARLLLEIVNEVRASVKPGFAVSVKLNSADFQRGGFSAEDAKKVVSMLNPTGLDLIELSGGSYESPAMQGTTRDGKTLAREAYFLEFARDIASIARMPIMVTGGIRRLPIANQVLDSGVHMVGIGTALALNPSLPNDWKQGSLSAPVLRPIGWKSKVLTSAAYMAMVKHQLRLISRGKESNPEVAPAFALLGQQVQSAVSAWRYRRWMRSTR